MNHKQFATAALAVGCGFLISHASSYPLDGYEQTRIGRLLGYRLALDGKIKTTVRIPPGGLLGVADVKLRLAGRNEAFDVSERMRKEPKLQMGLERIFSSRDPSYGIAVLDITDPAHPRYAALREYETRIPGSVGKLLVATGFFDALRQRYPDDVDARNRLLRDTVVVADRFVNSDGKTAPYFKTGDEAVVNRRIAIGDRLNLWEWLDNMFSVSSNAAGSTVWKQAMLLRKFGADYPPTPEQEQAFLASTPKMELGEYARETLEIPLRGVGLNTDRLKLGTFFTSEASKVIPGAGSLACPFELLRWLVRMEQGKLVDPWSSLEIKRLMYFTRPRYRYASSPSLSKAAVFFKSGSLFQCKPEEGFTCKAYAGNVTNLMHSVAVVESGEKVYLVAMMSNVLRVNSAAEHQTVAGEIERLLQSQ